MRRAFVILFCLCLGGVFLEAQQTVSNQATPNGVVAMNSAGTSTLGLTVMVVKTTGPGNVYGVSAANAAAAVCYLQFFNSTAPTVGTTAPTFYIPMAASVNKDLLSNTPLRAFTTAISVASTTGPTNGVACGTATPVTVFFK